MSEGRGTPKQVGRSTRGQAMVLFAASMLAVSLSGCVGLDDKRCPEGQTCWKCTIQPTPCHMTKLLFVCAGDREAAISAANDDAIFEMKLRDQTIVGTTCSDTGDRRLRSTLK